MIDIIMSKLPIEKLGFIEVACYYDITKDPPTKIRIWIDPKHITRFFIARGVSTNGFGTYHSGPWYTVAAVMVDGKEIVFESFGEYTDAVKYLVLTLPIMLGVK